MSYRTKQTFNMSSDNKWIRKIEIEIEFTEGSRPCKKDTNRIKNLIYSMAYFFQDTANDIKDPEAHEPSKPSADDSQHSLS